MELFIFIAVLLICIIIGLPTAFSLLITALALMLDLDCLDLQVAAMNIYNGLNNYSLLAIPLFILAGEIMNFGGFSRRIFDLAVKMVGHLRGGLGAAGLIAVAVMAFMSVSSLSVCAATVALLQLMSRQGYMQESSCGMIAAGAVMTQVIPPSVSLILLGVVTGVSVSKLLLAGIAAGILMAFTICAVWFFQCRHLQAKALPRVSCSELWISFKGAVWILLLPVLVVGGFALGVLTPTESGAVAVFYALFVAMCIYRELRVKNLYRLILSSCKKTAAVMLLVAAAQAFVWLMTIGDLAEFALFLLEPFLEHRVLLLILLLAIIFLLSVFFEPLSMILIFSPIIMPVAEEAGINTVYFGVLFVFVCSLGLLTPPVGRILSFVSADLKISSGRLMTGIMPYFGGFVLLLLCFVALPVLITVPLGWLAK